MSENGGFRKRSIEWRFSKTPFTCGRVKTEVFENDDAIGACDRLDDLILLDNAHAPHRAQSYLLRFCVYVWTGENDSNTLRVDAIFFKNGEKNSVFKNIRIRVDRA